MTKLQMMREFYNAIDEVREYGYLDKLYNLYKEKRITYGCYTIQDIYRNYHFETLLNKKLDYLTKWEVQYHIQELKKAIEEMKSFIEEQENLPFEETQMQQCIAKGTIRWM